MATRTEQRQTVADTYSQEGVGDFSQLEREKLKNAFRYICRLAFKESGKYAAQIKELLGVEAGR